MNKRAKPIRVLMVCLGNICRSPTAQAVLYKQVNDAELGADIEVDSAGTGAFHIDEKPDKRARSAAKLRGYDLSGLRARQIKPSDFENFDYILAMDDNNLRDLLVQCPPQLRHKIRLLMEFSDNNHESVPDPYYSDLDVFQLVLNLAEEACTGLLAHIRQQDLQ